MHGNLVRLSLLSVTVVALLAGFSWVALVPLAIILITRIMEFALRWRFGARAITRARDGELPTVLRTVLSFGDPNR